MNSDLSGIVKCGHCGNTAPAKVLTSHTIGETLNLDKFKFESSRTYQLAECFSCGGVVLLRIDHRDSDDLSDLWDPNLEVPLMLFPPLPPKINGLIDEVKTSWEAALAVKKINANAFAVLLGRVLDAVCEDRKAKPGKLFDRIEDLAGSGEFPPKVKEVAHKLRKLRNQGAHFDLGSLDARDAPLLESLCRVVLIYVYEAPALVLAVDAQAEQ